MTSQRVVVITGASSGIGAALALELSKRGDAVVLAARRKPELEAVAAACGPNALAVEADLTRRDEHRVLLARAIERFNHVDVWVNNVGRGITRSVLELTDVDLDAMITFNVKTALYGMQAVVPHFRARGEGHLINVSSVLGRMPFAPARSAYNAAKHALNALTANLRMELHSVAPRVHVSTFSPGVVHTEFGLNAMHGGVDSRDLPGQSAQEVAVALAELVAHPRADVYSRADYHAQVAAYFAAPDMAQVEAKAASPHALRT